MSQILEWYNFSFWGQEKLYVNEALDSTWLSGGEYLDKFESALSVKLKLPNAFLVSNGTAALQLAFLTIGIEPGDEVIVPAFGFMAAANVLKLMNAIPVFADINNEHWSLTTESIASKITLKTKAIVVIHNYGIVAEIEKIQQLAKSNNIFLIEDCAESIFSRFNNSFAGSFGDISTFSFHATKTISTGEGGMVTCRNDVLSEKLKLIRSHGLKREKKHYWHEHYGNNFRLSNILAAIGFGQLEKAEEIISNKDRVYQMYLNQLKDDSNIKFQKIPMECEPVVWAIAISINTNKFDRDSILEKLKINGVECRPGFYTPDQLPIYNNGSLVENYPIANHIAQSVIVLPSFPRLSNEDIVKICKILKSIVK